MSTVACEPLRHDLLRSRVFLCSAGAQRVYECPYRVFIVLKLGRMQLARTPGPFAPGFQFPHATSRERYFRPQSARDEARGSTYGSLPDGCASFGIRSAAWTNPAPGITFFPVPPDLAVSPGCAASMDTFSTRCASSGRNAYSASPHSTRTRSTLTAVVPTTPSAPIEGGESYSRAGP